MNLRWMKACKGLTHRQRLPWPCHRRIEQQRTPIHSISTHMTLRISSQGTHCLDLSRVNLHNSNASCDQFPSQRIGKAPDGCFRCTVDGSTGVRFPPRNTSDIDDIARATVGPLLHDGEDGLGHIDQAFNVRGHHDLDIFNGDVRRFRYSSYESSGNE
jgi:hypothetical protein